MLLAAPVHWRGVDLVWLFSATLLGLLGSGFVLGHLELEAANLALASAGVSTAVLGAAGGLVIYGRRVPAHQVGLRPAAPQWTVYAALAAVPLMPVLGLLASLVRVALGQPAPNPQLEHLALESLDAVQTGLMVILVAGAGLASSLKMAMALSPLAARPRAKVAIFMPACPIMEPTWPIMPGWSLLTI